MRRVAAEALAKVGTSEALASLVRALDDAHHDVRLAAVTGLGNIGSGRTAPQLLAAVEDPEWSVRCAAAESLAKLDDSAALPALVDAMEQGSLATKLAATEALGRIGDGRAVEPLVAVLGDLEGLRGPEGCDLRLRRNVAKALGNIGKVAALPALRVLTADRFTAGAAIESLGKVLRWDAASAGAEYLQALAEIDDVQQVPWVIDEAQEAASGRVLMRGGRAWSVDSTDLRAQALAELRRRENDR